MSYRPNKIAMEQLSILLSRFSFSARVFYNGQFCGANSFCRQEQVGHLHLVRAGTVIVHHDSHPSIHIHEPSLLFYPRGMNHQLFVPPGSPAQLLCATIAFQGGANNALAKAMPDYLLMPFKELSRLARTFDLLFEEAGHDEHGRQVVLDRLCEVLTIQTMRHAFQTGQLALGMLAGLSDPGLARALDAIHGEPAKPWSLERLAQIAGMSRSKFAKHFHDIVGTTPAGYLTDWRMQLAQNLLKANKSVKVVAQEVGYGSQPAFSKAFTAKFKRSPRAWLGAL
jgi:AraC-like DNA-binding protein